MIRNLIHATDPYAGFNPDNHPGEVRGWNDHSAHFNSLAKDAKLVLEIGSWLGNSAIQLAAAAPGAEIICLDTWLGAAEMWTDHSDVSRYGELRLSHGYPTIYWTFLANIVRAGLASRVTPMPMSSNVGLELLRTLGVQPDLIYVDGTHSYEGVTADLWGSLKLDPKIICGDDYRSWGGVNGAVNDFFKANGYKLNVTDGEFWWVEL